MKHKFEIDERDISDVKKNLRKDVVWLIWSAILIEASERDTIVKTQIQSLYKLFKYEFSMPKRNAKIPLIYHAIGYLTHTVNYAVPIINDKKIYIQCQCNVNQMFALTKVLEHTGPPKPPPHKEKKKQPTIQAEQLHDRFSILRDIDTLLS